MSNIGPKLKQLTALAAIIAALTLVSTLIPTDSASAQDPENGRFLYAHYGCLDCHGVDAQGDVGPKVSAISVSIEEFLTQIRTPREQMDAYPDDFLTDKQAIDIYTFLQTLP